MRLQLEQGVGGVVTAVFPSAPDAGSVRVSIRDKDAGELEDPVSGVELAADPFLVVIAVGGGTLAGDNILTGLALEAGTLPTRGDVVSIIRTDTGLRTQHVVKRALNGNPTGSVEFGEDLDVAAVPGDMFGVNSAEYAVTAANCADVAQNYRALFACTIDGRRVVREVVYDVGRRPNFNPATMEDLRSVWPDMADSMPVEWGREGGLELLDDGLTEVEGTLNSQGYNVNRLTNIETLRPPIANRALRIAAVGGTVPPEWRGKVTEYIDLLDRDYGKLIGLSLASAGWYDDDDDGVVDTQVVRTRGWFGR